MAAALLSSSHAIAQENPAPQQAQQLTCPVRQDDPLQAVNFGEPALVPYSQAERACWADWPQALALAQEPNGLWVDVRDAGSARRLALRGAVNVALANLADKAFLKKRSLVLVGASVDLRTMTRRCVALRQSGQYRDVHVLLGGVRSWRLAGQSIQPSTQSDGSALLPADEASARELWLGAADGQWKIAALNLSQQQRQSLPVPPAQVLDLGANVTQAVQELERQVAGQPLPAPSRWLVVAPDATTLAQAKTLWPQKTPNDQNTLIWLTGGWLAYAAWLQQQKTLAAHAGRSLPRICGL
jgi:rhodanese-related sulfurtransferase